MLAILTSSLLALMAHAAPQDDAATRTAYQVDAVHSTALFRVQHLGAGMFYGRFNDVSGTIEFGGADDPAPTFNVTISTGTVDTGTESLDDHLKSADFFDTENFPEMTFKSTAVERKSRGEYAVTGDLTIRGVTKSVTSDITWHGTADFGRGMRSGFETVFTVSRSDYGVSYGVDSGALGDETRIIVSMEAVKAEPRAAAEEGGLPARLAQFDANGDGRLQKDEAPERMQPLFDRLDGNGDGALEASELRGGRRPRGGDDDDSDDDDSDDDDSDDDDSDHDDSEHGESDHDDS